MGQVFHRIISGFLTAVFIFSAAVTGTYSWYSLQTTVNEAAQTIAAVQLQKREKLPDGTVTDHPVPGATFCLFTADGEQIGGRYVTDEAGAISLRLPAGSYYFEENFPAPGFAFDNRDGEPITHYPFILFEGDTSEVVVTAYNLRLTGSLAIQKTVQNADGSPLTAEQLAQDFSFTVEFSDGGTYIYQKGGEAGKVESGGTLTLRHGETALFENLPAGITYTVTEAENTGYTVSATGHRGTINADLSTAVFVNTYFEPPEPPGNPVRLTVTKEIAGEFPASDMDREFEMAVFINGKPTEFTLKPGESRVFMLNPGDWYEVWEKDYYAEGYSQRIANGFGTARIEDVVATVTNTFSGVVMKEIAGEKTWRGVGEDKTLLPESITLRLKDGKRIVDEITVTPDENGRWLYRFTAPKYDGEGNKIAYTVEELPVESFQPSYEGFDVINTYVPPAVCVFPAIYKTVEGDAPPAETFTFCITAKDSAPMPAGAKDSFLTLSLTGSGELFPGEIRFTKEGVYTYTVTETANNQDGWIYDTAVYTVTVTVTEEDSALTAAVFILKDNEPAEKIEFVNRYDRTLPPPDQTVIEGQKTWNHGSNPAEKQPDSIVVLVYADGEIVRQQLVTGADGWQYRFELPKYNTAGKEIVYTIDEAEVARYEKTIDGYDLLNTYQEDGTEDPSDPGKEPPPTGDTTRLWPWFLLMILSGGATLLLGIRRRRGNENCTMTDTLPAEML